LKRTNNPSWAAFRDIPNKFVAEAHDRMPVILEAKDFEQWECADVKDAAALLVSAGKDNA
jgi:putative SOS response-associated peptidase YedK